MKFSFFLPVDIRFGNGELEQLSLVIKDRGFKKGVLICDEFFVKNGKADAVLAANDGVLLEIFSDFEPNPTVEAVDKCVVCLNKTDADFAVALGGGSALDCAKAACRICKSGDSVTAFHTGGKPIKPEDGIGLIAVPTTSGTGSEVTCVSVLTDTKKNLKTPLGSPLLYPDVAIVDPQLTHGLPRSVTASTGLDALSHAMEGYWSIHHQPICDALAMSAAKLIFEHFSLVIKEPGNAQARENMSLASLMAGIAFSHPKTTAPHACSFPLTNQYGIPHGEACALTLDAFLRINAISQPERLHAFADYCGFNDVDAMADEIHYFKEMSGLRTTFSQAGITPDMFSDLAHMSMHPNIKNNPVTIDENRLSDIFRTIG